MPSKFMIWWQKVKQQWVAIVVFASVLVIVFALIGVGYRFDWTGFARKTLWDWMQLLIIPLVLAVAALLFNFANSRTEQNIALDRQREDLLQVYLDRMSELLLKEKLRSSEADAEVRNVARVRTIAILFQLDARRIGYVFAFLRESGLMATKQNESIVNLRDAYLYKVNLREANLWGADFRGAYLRGADLSKTILSEANLSNANLRETNLRGADLSEANLRGAYLRGADLTGADLWGADLHEAMSLSEEVEKQAKSLKGATMPNGSKHL